MDGIHLHIVLYEDTQGGTSVSMTMAYILRCRALLTQNRHLSGGNQTKASVDLFCEQLEPLRQWWVLFKERSRSFGVK